MHWKNRIIWGEVSNLVDFSILEKSVKTVSLNELLNTFPDMLSGKLNNRILVDVNS